MFLLLLEIIALKRMIDKQFSFKNDSSYVDSSTSHKIITEAVFGYIFAALFLRLIPVIYGGVVLKRNSAIGFFWVLTLCLVVWLILAVLGQILVEFTIVKNRAREVYSDYETQIPMDAAFITMIEDEMRKQ